MRRQADLPRIRNFLQALGRRTSSVATVYLSGGATAVMHGWRPSTIDIALRLEPEADDLLRVIAALKDELQTNVELASPLDFIPEPPGWRERSKFVAQEGQLTIRHMDLYAQALAKIERDHPLDRSDVRSMLAGQLVEPSELRRLYEDIEPLLYRFPTIDVDTFRAQLERTLQE